MENIELLSSVALSFVSKKPFDEQMNFVLKEIGKHLIVSRVYIFIDSPDGLATNNAYEWCDAGIAAQINELQNVPYAMIPSWRSLLVNEGKVCSENIQEFPDDIRAILEPQNIIAIVVYPLIIDNSIQGFLGFDECRKKRRWSEAELGLLKTISGIISNAWERNIYASLVQKSEENYRTFFETIDDLIIIGTKEGHILYCNNAVKDKLGYTEDDFDKMNMIDFHPKDYRIEAADIYAAMFRNERNSCPLPLQIKNGGMLSVETRIWFGKWNNIECIFGISKDLSRQQSALDKFNKLFDHNPALMAVTSLPEHKFTDVNAAFLEKLGYRKSDVIGKNSGQLELFLEPEKQLKITEQLLLKGEIRDVELKIRKKDGGILNGMFSGVIINNQGQKSLLTVMIDVTRQHYLQEETHRQKERLNFILTGTNAGTWEWNIKTGETVFNERWAQIMGYSLQELEPVSIDTWMKMAHPDDLKISEELLGKHFNGENEYYEAECRMKHKNGEWVWVYDHGKVTEWDTEGNPVMMFGTHIDITQLKRTQEMLKEIAIRDPLTSIYNRRYVFERMNQMLEINKRNAEMFSTAIIDIDFFKHVNDTYGHLAGDHILKEFSSFLNKKMRPYDLLGRYGGEEFIIVFLGIDKKQAQVAVDRFLQAVRETSFVFDGQEMKITFSCGISDISEIDAVSSTVDMLIEMADSRMYNAKKTGRNKTIIAD